MRECSQLVGPLLFRFFALLRDGEGSVSKYVLMYAECWWRTRLVHLEGCIVVVQHEVGVLAGRECHSTFCSG